MQVVSERAVAEVADSHVTVQKSVLDLGRENVAGVKLCISSDADHAVTVELVEVLPEHISMSDVQVHPSYRPEKWDIDRSDHRMVFKDDVGPGEEVETVYGVRVEDVDDATPFTREPAITVTRQEPDEEGTDDAEALELQQVFDQVELGHSAEDPPGRAGTEVEADLEAAVANVSMAAGVDDREVEQADVGADHSEPVEDPDVPEPIDGTDLSQSIDDVDLGSAVAAVELAATAAGADEDVTDDWTRGGGSRPTAPPTADAGPVGPMSPSPTGPEGPADPSEPVQSDPSTRTDAGAEPADGEGAKALSAAETPAADEGASVGEVTSPVEPAVDGQRTAEASAVESEADEPFEFGEDRHASPPTNDDAGAAPPPDASAAVDGERSPGADAVETLLEEVAGTDLTDDQRAVLREALDLEPSHSQRIQLAHLQSSVARLEAFADEFEAFVDAVGSPAAAIDDLGATQAELVGRVDALAASVAEAAEDREALRAEIEQVDAELDDQRTAHRAEVEALDERLAELEDVFGSEEDKAAIREVLAAEEAWHRRHDDAEPVGRVTMAPGDGQP